MTIIQELVKLVGRSISNNKTRFNSIENVDLPLCRTCKENGRVVYVIDSHGDDAVRPLAMTIDTDGLLYVASYYGGEVLRINPRLLAISNYIKRTIFQYFNR